ncbi:MAG: arylsulfate sulfotransferase [Sulfurimonas sp.]|jgi:arylsulfate sulfotransferase
MLKQIVSSVALTAVMTAGVSVLFTQDLSAAVYERKNHFQGSLGKVHLNPYKISPLTAVIDRYGQEPTNIKVTVLGKPNGGRDITYNVSDAALRNHDGVPVFGLYDDYINNVKVEMTLDGKRVVDHYKIRTNPFNARITDGRMDIKPKVKVTKVAKGFEDRLYAVTLMGNADNKEWAWATPHHKTHGSGEWLEPAEIYLVDTQGEIRWYFDTNYFYDKYGRNIDDLGRIMSMHLTENGDLMFGQAQKYFRYSMMGEKSFSRKLPRGYVDLSHEVLPMKNGHTLLRVGKQNYHIPGTHDIATTVRDIIIEVDAGGRLVQEWDFNKILGNNVFRKDLILALDARAVCLNIDMNAKHIEIKHEAPYGDNTSTGTGRNWAHINSISYDPSDDTIIASLRHQGIMKVGRDMKVKWILASPQGWSKDMKAKILTPVSKNGKKLECKDNKCKNTDFDWSWTQHTAWLSPHGKNVGDIKTLSVFDNGDGRGMEQPAFKTDKYSRGVEYVIDEKNLTVKQTWEFGKERGYDLYSPVTSNTQYETDTGTYQMMFGDADLLTKKPTKGYIIEVDPKDNDIKVELQLSNAKKPAVYYRAITVRPNKLFSY